MDVTVEQKDCFLKLYTNKKQKIRHRNGQLLSFLVIMLSKFSIFEIKK